ncbi:MAG: helix-turn-helix transcriptional regulator [Rhodoplanes sp.]
MGLRKQKAVGPVGLIDGSAGFHRQGATKNRPCIGMLLWPQLVQFNLFGVREGKIAVGDRRRDAVVGHNIRILREDRGISQTELGRKIGVVFQQVQKYENGENRVCCGRLFKIASALDAPITAFFEGVDQSISADAASSPVSLLAEPYALRLAHAFCALESADLQRSLVEITEHMAGHALSSQRAGDGDEIAAE